MKLPIAERKEITAGTVEIAFDISGKNFPFQGGQYVEVSLPQLLYGDERGKSRNFSIVSSPNDKKYLRIAFRSSESGFKKTLCESAVGSEVEVSGPFGDMALPNDSSVPIIFVAGGIGITPFLSMLRFITEEKLPYTITLLYANKEKSNAAYLAELEAMAKQNPRFSLQSHFGIINEETIRKAVDGKDAKSVSWFVVGPPAMALETVKIIQGLGVSKERVRFTEFGGYTAPIVDQSVAPVSQAAVLANEIVRIETIPGLSESLLQALDKNVLVSVTDLNGSILYANSKFVEVSKYTLEELIGKNHRILKSGFHSSRMYEDLWQTISSGKAWRGEIKNKAKDGSSYWVDANIAPIFSKNNTVSGYIAIRFLITERKELEEKMEESKKAMMNLLEDVLHEKDISERRTEDLQKFQSAVENTSQHVIITDLEGVIIYANPAVTQTTGYSPAEIVGKKPSLWGRQMSQEFYSDMWHTIKVEKKTFLGELRNKRKNGDIYTVFANISPVLNAQGEVKFFVGLETDISKQKEFDRLLQEEKESVERKVVERTQELKEEKARLLASINSLSFGFIIADTDNKVLVKNAAISTILELEKEPVSVSDLAASFKGVSAGLDVLSHSCRECIQLKKVVELKEVSHGKKYLRVFCTPILTKNDDLQEKVIGYVMLVEDITEAKVMERSRDEFFAVASHELRTPLTAIRGNADMILDMYADKIVDKDMREMLQDIDTSSVRLISIVNDFLEVSRLEQGRIEMKKEVVDLSELIEKIIRSLKEMVGKKGLVLSYAQPASPVPPVLADKDKVEQVLINLVGNAIKFTKEGSITISAGVENGFVAVRITDTGSGISEHNQALLFRKFQPAGEQMLARDVTQSTGLGLYISRLILSGMSGTIGLEKSEIGKGSTFIFTLPISK